ncbi:hypothetical protein ACFL2C_03530 [Patescibacteria group bacterium]
MTKMIALIRIVDGNKNQNNPTPTVKKNGKTNDISVISSRILSNSDQQKRITVSNAFTKIAGILYLSSMKNTEENPKDKRIDVNTNRCLFVSIIRYL